MANLLRNLVIDEVSFCKEGANQDAKVSLFKSMEQDNMPENDAMKQENDTLKGQVAALNKKIEDLEAAAVQKPVDTVEKKIEKIEDPEVKAHLAKIQAAADASAIELKKANDAIAKMQESATSKEIQARLEKCPRAIAGEKLDEMVAKFVKLDADTREVVFKSFEKSEAVAGSAESMFKETGSSKTSEHGNAYKEICAKAAELRSKAPENMKKSDSQLRVEVRKAFPELAQRERDEADA